MSSFPSPPAANPEALEREAPWAVARSAEPPLVVVVIPAYNEEQSIGATVEGLAKWRTGVSEVRVLIFVINDGSGDRTAELALEAGADRVVSHKKNRGLGAAVRTALQAARAAGAEIAVKFDADGQHDPADIERLIAPVLKDEADLVYGDRMGRIEYKMPFVRRMGNIVFTRMMAWLTGWSLTDSQPGVFAAHRGYLERCYLPGNYNYTQQILLDAYHLGLRFQQVPVSFRKRTTGKSFISLKYPFKVLPQLVRVLVGVQPLRVFAPIGLLFLGIAMVLVSVEVTEWLLGETKKPVVHVNALLACLILGLHTLSFGLIADLIVGFNRRNFPPPDDR